MSRKFSDLFFSYGLMIVGAGLLLLGSMAMKRSTRSNSLPVSILPRPVTTLAVNNLPTIEPVHAAQLGGDIEVPSPFPASRPIIPLLKEAPSSFSTDLTAAAVVVVDDKTNTILFKKNIEAVRPLASITKLMSALVLSDLPLDWASTTVVKASDIDSDNHIMAGEEYSRDDLWHIALIGSSNSAINALVRASGLTSNEFVAEMNKKANDLHLLSLHFIEPTGLDSGNVGNADDVARLLKAAVSVEKIYQTLQIPEYYAQPLQQDVKPRRITATDWLLTNWVPNTFKIEDIVGKTGYIDASGYNFVVRLSDSHGHAVRATILGASSNETRFSEARDLAEWTFNHYLWPDQAGYDKLVE